MSKVNLNTNLEPTSEEISDESDSTSSSSSVSNKSTLSLPNWLQITESTSTDFVKERLNAVKSHSEANYGASCSGFKNGHNRTKFGQSSELDCKAENKLDCIKSKADSVDSEWFNVCRICHGGISIGDLLSPCHCRGSIAKTHIECLERWLKESASSRCELCQHHFQIVRQPKYGVIRSIFVFLRHPGEHLREILLDLCGFIIYTPATIGSTYMLMLLCESVSNSGVHRARNPTVHVMTLAAVMGMAAIDFTYSSWLAANFQKHLGAWRNWYRNHCDVKVVLPVAEKQSELILSTTLNDVD